LLSKCVESEIPFPISLFPPFHITNLSRTSHISGFSSHNLPYVIIPLCLTMLCMFVTELFMCLLHLEGDSKHTWGSSCPASYTLVSNMVTR
jgi:hypothetical protein